MYTIPIFRRLYWSDCSQPSSINSISVHDYQDRTTLVANNETEAEKGCFTALVIDSDSTCVTVDLLVNLTEEPSLDDMRLAADFLSFDSWS